MSKLPARKGDAVSNDPHGDGKITSGDSSVLFLGKPVACVGDSAEFGDGTEGTIKEGGACVVVNGKRVALVDDGTTESGKIADGAGSIKVSEGNTFVHIGPNVRIGKNVTFRSKPVPPFNQHFELQNEKNSKPIQGIDYFLKADTIGLIDGLSNKYGTTNIAGADAPEDAEVYSYTQSEIDI
jgi:uncharacterized Zn-binding protein involved in type VI secretion